MGSTRNLIGATLAAIVAFAVVADIAEATFMHMHPNGPPPFRGFGNSRNGPQGPEVVPPLRFPPGAFGVRVPMPFPALDPNRIVRFQLYTRENPKEGEILEPGKLKSETSKFRSNRSTKVLVHGFVDSATEASSGEWMSQMRNAYLNTSDVNVVIVNYSFLALFLFQWTNLPQVSSRRLSSLIYSLHKEAEAPYESFHLIGRSWGSHVAGMAGYALNGKVGRITGLDPASPPLRFLNFEYRLDKSDARFVDVYHLNGKTRFPFLDVLGVSRKLATPMGHVDVYPNFRERMVTGCPVNNASFYTPSCMLGLGARLFVETIKREDAFPVCPCETYTKYVRGECVCEIRNTVNMGEYISMDTKGVFQMLTLRVEPKPEAPSGPLPTGLIPIIGLTTKSTTTATPATTPGTTGVGNEIIDAPSADSRSDMDAIMISQEVTSGSSSTMTSTNAVSTSTSAAIVSSTNASAGQATDNETDASFTSEDAQSASASFVTKDSRANGEAVTLFQTSVPNLYVNNP